MEKLKEISERLKVSIDFANEHNEDLDARSWGYEEGVLLSHNEAKLIVELIEKEILKPKEQKPD